MRISSLSFLTVPVAFVALSASALASNGVPAKHMASMIVSADQVPAQTTLVQQEFDAYKAARTTLSTDSATLSADMTARAAAVKAKDKAQADADKAKIAQDKATVKTDRKAVEAAEKTFRADLLKLPKANRTDFQTQVKALTPSTTPKSSDEGSAHMPAKRAHHTAPKAGSQK